MLTQQMVVAKSLVASFDVNDSVYYARALFFAIEASTEGKNPWNPNKHIAEYAAIYQAVSDMSADSLAASIEAGIGDLELLFEAKSQHDYKKIMEQIVAHLRS